MVQGVRSSATEVVFDLHSEAGVVAALAAVRGSQLSREEKSELRDLIFAYKNEPDASFETTILSALASITPTQTQTPTVLPGSEVVPLAVLATEYIFGRTRPQPVFAPLPVATIHIPRTLVSTPVAEAVTIPPNLPVAPIPAEPDLPVAIPTLVSNIEPEPVRIVPVSVVTADMVPKAVVDEKLAAVAPTPEATTELKPPYQEDQSLDVYRNRITEIKQFINQKVGNPVNLVDLDNTVGRAYMGALLEAMKAVSGGGGDVIGLMAKLEAVVKEVETVIKTKQTTDDTKTAASSTVVPSADTVVQIEVSEVAHAAASTVIPVPQKAAETTAMSTPKIISPVVPVRQVEDSVTPVSPLAVSAPRFKNVIPVTAQEPLKTPKDLPTAAELKARSGITDPLADPDIDLGLEQLLGEWALFRKSGVFGTGPKGTQHPLYQKLASLAMPLVLSGRFEGATAEIRQSITDYMNGWRYEQGIIYEQEETFEHYLRRVIRHIIDSQTRRRTA